MVLLVPPEGLVIVLAGLVVVEGLVYTGVVLGVGLVVVDSLLTVPVDVPELSPRL